MNNEKNPLVNKPESVQNSIIQALTNIYLFGYYIDIHSGFFTRIEMSHNSRQSFNHSNQHENERRWFLEHIVSSEYRDRLEAFTDMSTIEDRLRGNNVIFEDYINYNNIWVRCAYIPAD